MSAHTTSQPIAGIGSNKETWAVAINYIVGRKRAEEALGFLAEVSKALAGTLDYEHAVDTVAALAVPYIADYCGIDLFVDRHALRQAAIATSDKLDRKTVPKIRAYLYPQLSPAGYGVQHVIEQGRAEIVAVSDERGQAGLAQPERVNRLDALGMRSCLIVPIVARGQRFGAISLMASAVGLGRRYGAADVALVEQVALRIAAAVELGRLHGKQDATP